MSNVMMVVVADTIEIFVEETTPLTKNKNKKIERDFMKDFWVIDLGYPNPFQSTHARLL